MDKVHYSSARTNTGRDDWCTPLALVDLLDSFGPVELDPCSNAESRVRSTRRFVLECGQDGLAKAWSSTGLNYVNPPYSQLKKWLAKGAEEWERHQCESVFLIPARTDTRAWHEGVEANACAFVLIKGRLRFLGAPASAPFPSALVYFGPEPLRFTQHFGHLGSAHLTPGALSVLTHNAD